MKHYDSIRFAGLKAPDFFSYGIVHPEEQEWAKENDFAGYCTDGTVYVVTKEEAKELKRITVEELLTDKHLESGMDECVASAFVGMWNLKDGSVLVIISCTGGNEGFLDPVYEYENNLMEDRQIECACGYAHGIERIEEYAHMCPPKIVEALREVKE